MRSTGRAAPHPARQEASMMPTTIRATATLPSPRRGASWGGKGKGEAQIRTHSLHRSFSFFPIMDIATCSIHVFAPGHARMPPVGRILALKLVTRGGLSDMHRRPAGGVALRLTQHLVRQRRGVPLAEEDVARQVL